MVGEKSDLYVVGEGGVACQVDTENDVVGVSMRCNMSLLLCVKGGGMQAIVLGFQPQEKVKCIFRQYYPEQMMCSKHAKFGKDAVS